MTTQELQLKAIDITLQLVQSNQITLKAEPNASPENIIDNLFAISDLIIAKLDPPQSELDDKLRTALAAAINR